MNGLVFRLPKIDHPGEIEAEPGQYDCWGRSLLHIGDCYVGLRHLETIFHRKYFRTIKDSFVAGEGRASGKFIQMIPNPLSIEGWITIIHHLLPPHHLLLCVKAQPLVLERVLL